MVKKFRLSAIISSIIMAAIGITLLIKPELSLKIICYAVAVLVLGFSAAKFVEYVGTKKESETSSIGTLISAIFTALLGFFLILRPTTISQIVPIVLGLIVISHGFIIFGLGVFYRLFLPKKGLWSMIFGIICVVLGLLCSLYSFNSQFLLIQFIGASMLITGLSNIINHIMVEKAECKKEETVDVEFTTTTNYDSHPAADSYKAIDIDPDSVIDVNADTTKDENEDSISN